MITFLAQNQFLSDSGTPPSTAVPETAAADQVAPQVAAAEPIAACRDRGHASVLDVSSAGMLMQDRPVTNLIQSSDGGQWPTADAPSLGNPHQRSSEPIASGHGIDPTGPSEAIPASTIADPDGGYMGHRLSPALGTSVGMAAIDSCQEPVAADPIDHIGEIFHWVRKLLKDDRRFVLNEGDFMAEVDEIPLFIREDGYLRRQA